ncbi:MAG: hypothetical protein ACLQA5_01620, partial [Solirubrobacteraceae bacterium]
MKVAAVGEESAGIQALRLPSRCGHDAVAVFATDHPVGAAHPRGLRSVGVILDGPGDLLHVPP